MSDAADNPFVEEALSDETPASLSHSHASPVEEAPLPTTSSSSAPGNPPHSSPQAGPPAMPPTTTTTAEDDADDAPLASAAYPFSADPYPQDEPLEAPAAGIDVTGGGQERAREADEGTAGQGESEGKAQQRAYERPRRDAIQVRLPLLSPPLPEGRVLETACCPRAPAHPSTG